MNVLSIDVAVKGIRETVRDKRCVGFLVGLPVIYIVLFAFAFGSGTFLSGGSLPHEIVVINNDAGVNLALNNTTKHVNYGTNFTQVLENATTENSTTNLFHLNNASKQKADDLLKSRGIDALIIIPNNFSAGIATMVNNSTRTAISSTVGQQSIANATSIAAANAAAPFGSSVSVPGANVILPKAGNTTATLSIEGDAGFMNFATSQALIKEVFDQYKNGIQANATTRAAPGVGDSIFKDFVSVEALPIAGTQSYSLFDYLVPGLIVFALLMQSSLVSSSLVREKETGMLDRLKLSKIRASDLLSGTFITWTIIGVGQILILIAVAIVLGYNHQGDISSLGLALLIGVIAGMASIALALLIASFAKNDLQAILLGAMLSVPLGFMAGAFFPLPRQVLGEVAGRTYVLWDILPWTHAVSALRSVLTYGRGLSGDVVFEMYWLIILTAILFVIGVVTYSRTRLKAEK